MGSDPNSQNNYYMKTDGSWATGDVKGSAEIGKNNMGGHHPSFAPTEDLPKGKMNPSGKGYSKENPTE